MREDGNAIFERGEVGFYFFGEGERGFVIFFCEIEREIVGIKPLDLGVEISDFVV